MHQRTLFISCATLGSGGAERVLSILSKPFAEEYGRVVYLLWLHHPVFYQIDRRVEIVDIEKEAKSKNILKKMWWVRKFVQKNKPDLILSFLYPWSMKLIVSLLFTPFKIVVAERRDPKQVKGGWVIRKLRDYLYSQIEAVIVQTGYNKNCYPVSLRKKTHIIYNPVGMTEDWIGKALHTKKNSVIVSVGRLRPEKNHDLLIEAFYVFSQDHPNYKLVIYGEGERRMVLERLIQKLNISDSVHLAGNTKEVLSNIVSAKLFVLSSNFEGMPNALLEAMCLGLPCISTKVSGAVDLIQSGENGILVDIGDKEQMVSAMNQIADNEGYSERLARNAVKIYEKTNVNLISQKWLAFLNEVMEVQ